MPFAPRERTDDEMPAAITARVGVLLLAQKSSRFSGRSGIFCQLQCLANEASCTSAYWRWQA